jgi:hypothetical protein
MGDDKEKDKDKDDGTGDRPKTNPTTKKWGG